MKKTKKEPQSISTVPQEMDWNYFSPLEVEVINNNFDKAFRAFKMMVQSEKILALYKEKQSFEKPSAKKRRKHNESVRRVKQAELKQQKIISGELDKEKAKKQLKKDKSKAKSKE